jgi:hypothetical protein
MGAKLLTRTPITPKTWFAQVKQILSEWLGHINRLWVREQQQPDQLLAKLGPSGLM